MSYNSVFGGSTIYPSQPEYLAVALSANIELTWPLESNSPTYPAARIIGVTSTGAYSITLPDATLASVGQTILFANYSGSTNSITIKDNSGSTVVTIAVGETFQLYLSANSTAAGVWKYYQAGATVATAQASALAGYGLVDTSNTLSQSLTVVTFNSTPRSLATTDRAKVLVWNGTGSGEIDLLSCPTAGNGFGFEVHNDSGGDLTLDPDGSDTLDGAATLVLQPGESTALRTDGTSWYTVGRGQDAVFAFDYTVVDLTGETSPYVLSGSELNRVAYKFIGTLTADMVVQVPSTIQQYWVDNATSGAYTLSLNTSTGVAVSVSQGARSIYYCSGTNVVAADTGGLSTPIAANEGGTGQSSYTTGDMLYASSATVLSKLNAVAVGNVLTSAGVSAAPVWGQVNLATSVTGMLPVANGGTGAANAADARTALGLGSLATASTINGSNWSGTDLAVADGGTGSSTAADARTALGAAASGVNTDITELNSASGVKFGAPTAGSWPGTAGTINATGIYVNGVSVGTSGGTVSSVALSGGTTGLTSSGGPITSAGTLTLGGTLAVANGGTGSGTASGARTALGAAASGTNTDITALNSTTGVTLGSPTAGSFPGTVGNINAKGFYVDGVAVGVGSGTVSSVDISGGTTGLTSSGGPITTTGTLTLGGTLAVANGGTGSGTQSGARTNLGLGSLATASTINGSNWSGTDLAVADGGTGASTAADARTNLGLGTIATQAANSVSISGGSITGITDLAVADGGTGSSTAAGARTNLGAAASGANGDITTLSALGDGSAASPSLTYSADTNTGFYRAGVDTVGITAGGTSRATISTTEAYFAVPVRPDAGSAAAPTHSFVSDTNTGVYSVGADDLGFSVGGTLRMDISTSVITTTLPTQTAAGSAATPAYSFATDTNTGMYSIGADSLGLSVGGTLRVTLTTSTLVSTVPFYAPSGSAAAPAYSFSSDLDTGIYYTADPYVNVAVAGTRVGLFYSGGFSAVGGVDGTYFYATGDYLRIGTSATPASAADTGTTGQIKWDSNYIYVCVNTNTWKRVAIATWP